MIAVTIATTAVWVAGVCTLVSLHRATGPAGAVAVPAPASPVEFVTPMASAALAPGPRVSPEDEPVMPTLPAPPFIPSPRSPLR